MFGTIKQFKIVGQQRSEWLSWRTDKGGEGKSTELLVNLVAKGSCLVEGNWVRGALQKDALSSTFSALPKR